MLLIDQRKIRNLLLHRAEPNQQFSKASRYLPIKLVVQLSGREKFIDILYLYSFYKLLYLDEK